MKLFGLTISQWSDMGQQIAPLILGIVGIVKAHTAHKTAKIALAKASAPSTTITTPAA